MKNLVVVGIVIVILGLGGYLLLGRQATETSLKTSNTVYSSPTTRTGNETATQTGFAGKQLAKDYYEFNQADYDRLLVSGEGVLLFFYANWCPTCAVQEPVMVSAMNAGVNKGKVALRVNYNDTQTDAAEKALAQKFGVTYQHTFVGVSSTGERIFLVNGQQSQAQLQELFTKI